MTADPKILVKKKANASKLVTSEEYEMIVIELVIYRDNKRCIGLTKSFEKSIQNN